MAFPAIAAGIGALVSAASSAVGAINSTGVSKRQRKMIDFQYGKEEAYQKKMAEHNWRNYNSPAAQRAAMRAAGINPFVGDSDIGGMQIDSNSSGPDLQEPADPGAGFASNIMAGASSLFDNLASIKQLELTDAQIENVNANTAKIRSETLAQDNQNSLFDLFSATEQEKYLSSRYLRVVSQIKSEFAEREITGNLAEQQARIQKLLEDAAHTSADRENQRILLPAIKKELETRSASNTANAANADARTKTEDLLRQGRANELLARKDEIEQHIKKMVAETSSEEQREDLLYWQSEYQRALAEFERSPTGEKARRLERVGRAVWTAFGPGAIFK